MKLSFKEFLRYLRIIELEHAYIVLCGNVTPKLYDYIITLRGIKWTDESYHTYFGEISFIINNFIQYWMKVINDANEIAEKITNTINKDILLEIIENSIVLHQAKQLDFGKLYFPIQTLEEKHIYNEIEQKYGIFMDTLIQLKDNVKKFDRLERVHEFSKKHLELSIQTESAVMKLIHAYMSLILADHLKEIRTSLEENLSCVRNNLRQRQEEREFTVNGWWDDLYNINKERTLISRRQGRRFSMDLAEVEKAIKNLIEKIEEHQQNTLILHLDEEVQYWQRKLLDFNDIEQTLLKLRKEKENLFKQTTIYRLYKCTELPGLKLTAWQNIGETLKKRKQFINVTYLAASRALVTFFAVRGVNSISFRDEIAAYVFNEFGHKIYLSDHDQKTYKVGCDGSFKLINERGKYLYDNTGRYILDDKGQKIYQCGPCSSCYKLGDDDLLLKISNDCGHSEKVMSSCEVERKANDFKVVHVVDPAGLKGTSLNRDDIAYIKKSLCLILLDHALYDVGQLRSKNPIHSLACTILNQKYRRTSGEIEEMRQSFDNYRTSIYKKRKAKAVAASLAWKAEETTRRKPEESDDTQEIAVYDSYIAAYEFIKLPD